MNPADEAERELLWRHVSGALEAHEEEAVRRLLSGHPEYADELLEMAGDRLAIEEALASRKARRRLSPRLGAWSGVRPFWLAAAGLFLGFVSLLLLAPRRGGRPASEDSVRAGTPPGIEAGRPPERPVKGGPERKPSGEVESPPKERPEPAGPGLDRERIEEEMREAVRRAREKRGPAAVPGEAPVPRPEPVRPAPRETRPGVAVLERIEGRVQVLDSSGEAPARQGTPLLKGQGLRTAAGGGRAILEFPDGTRLDLLTDSEILDVEEEEGQEGRGKRLRLARGTVAAEVSRQPAGRPMVLETPQAEVRVLGTRFTLRVEGESTRLEVREGKVRLTRQGGLAAVDVAAGHFAVAAPGTTLASKPFPPEVVRVSFGPADAPLPPEFTGDDGSPWDEARGRGWSRDRRAETRLRPGSKEILLRRHISAGDSTALDRWEIRLAEGKYHVVVLCGDAQRAQGPHRVTVEGRPLIRDFLTGAGEQVRGEGIVEVKDGRLTFDFGAVGSTRTDPEGDSDTVLQYVVITRLW